MPAGRGREVFHRTGLHEQTVLTRLVGKATMPADHGREQNLGRILVVAVAFAIVWATLACGASAEERLLRDYAECLVDSNSVLHRRHVENRIGTVPLSAEGMKRWLNRQLEHGTLTMDEIRNNYSRYCD